jgi:methylmalonyl-CoA mutase
MEWLTGALAERAEAAIAEVERLGGMTRAVEAGMPKLKIEEAATKRQARIDRGIDIIVGVNKYQTSKQEPLDIRVVDNSAVCEVQRRRLEKLRALRNAGAVAAALDALTKAAESESSNLLEHAVVAARARASVGEISLALEKVFGRHHARAQTVSGVYGAYYKDDPEWHELTVRVEQFLRAEGRRPRLLVAKVGQDGHDRGAKLIASGFADLGFDVDLGPLFQTPEEVARQAIENDVHAIGISTQAGAHTSLVPKLIDELRRQQAGDIKVVCGGIIPEQDHERLLEAGVAAVFAPGTALPAAARRVLELLGA